MYLFDEPTNKQNIRFIILVWAFDGNRVNTLTCEITVSLSHSRPIFTIASIFKLLLPYLKDITFLTDTAL